MKKMIIDFGFDFDTAGYIADTLVDFENVESVVLNCNEKRNRVEIRYNGDAKPITRELDWPIVKERIRSIIYEKDEG